MGWGKRRALALDLVLIFVKDRRALIAAGTLCPQTPIAPLAIRLTTRGGVFAPRY